MSFHYFLAISFKGYTSYKHVLIRAFQSNIKYRKTYFSSKFMLSYEITFHSVDQPKKERE